MNTLEQIADTISEYRDRLSISVIDRMFDQRASLRRKYESFYERLVSDVQFHFDYLEQGIRYSSHELLSNYASWLVVFFRDINVPVKEIELTFDLMESELRLLLDKDEQKEVTGFFNIIRNGLSDSAENKTLSYLETDNPYKELAVEYFNLIMAHRKQEAAKLLVGEIKSGMNIKDVYLYVFQRSQNEVGRLWQSSRLTVAEEHYFTAATQLIIAQLYPYLFPGSKTSCKVVAGCVGKELHEIGMRTVADFFEMEGWDSIYIGANTPTSTMLDIVRKEYPDLLALSVTVVPHLKQLRRIITAIRDDKELSSLKILVGGYALNTQQDLWKKLGADAYAVDAQTAVETAKKLVC